MIFDSFPEFLPAEYRVKFATEPWERAPSRGTAAESVLRGARSFRKR